MAAGGGEGADLPLHGGKVGADLGRGRIHALAGAVVEREVGEAAVEQRVEARHLRRVGSDRLGQRVGDRQFAHDDPGVDALGMGDDEGDHAQARGIAHAEMALQRRVEPGGPRVAAARQVLGQVVGEVAPHVERHDLAAVGVAQRMLGREARIDRGAVAAVAPEAVVPQQVAAGDLGLAAGGERVDGGVEGTRAAVDAGQADHRAVGAAQHEVLALGAHALDLGAVDLALAQVGDAVVALADDALGLLLGRQVVGEDDEVERALGRGDAVGGGAPARRRRSPRARSRSASARAPCGAPACGRRRAPTPCWPTAPRRSSPPRAGGWRRRD